MLTQANACRVPFLIVCCLALPAAAQHCLEDGGPCDDDIELASFSLLQSKKDIELASFSLLQSKKVLGPEPLLAPVYFTSRDWPDSSFEWIPPTLVGCPWSPPPRTVQAACCGAALLVILIATGRLAAQRAAGVDLKEPSRRAEYVAMLNNARFFGSLGVVVYHYFLHVPGRLRFIEAWSSPIGLACMSFISGTLSKSPPTRSKLNSLLWAVVLPFMLYTAIYASTLEPLLWRLAGNCDPEAERSFLRPPLDCPEGPRATLHNFYCASPTLTWYLQALIVWRFLVWGSHIVAGASGTPMWPWFVAVSLSLLVASAYRPMQVFSLDNAIGYLPVFAAGVLFPLEELVALIPAEVCWTRGAGGLLCAVCWTRLNPLISTFPIKALFWSLMSSYSCISVLSFCEGLFTALVLATVIVCVLVLMCPRGEYWFTKAGQGTMYVYLLHTPCLLILQIVLQLKVVSFYPPLQSWQFATVNTILAVVVGFCLAALLSSAPVQRVFSPVIEPKKWLDSRNKEGQEKGQEKS